MSNQTLITLTNLVKTFPIGKRDFTALDNINLNFQQGEFTGVVGPSGSGKTTLLNIVGSLDVPTKGEALVLGESIAALSLKKAANLRNKHLGFIFQTFITGIYSIRKC